MNTTLCIIINHLKPKFLYIIVGLLLLYLLTKIDFSVVPNTDLSGEVALPKADVGENITENLFNFFYNSLIIGLCFFLGLIAFVQGLYSRDKTYLLWALYLLANSLFFFAGLDYNFEMNLITGALHFGWEAHRRPWTIPMQYLVAIAYLAFVVSFLKLRENDYKLHRFIVGLQLLLGFLTISAFYAVKVYQFTDFFDVFIFVIFIFLGAIFLRIINLKIPQKNLLMIGSMGVLCMGIVAAFIDQGDHNYQTAFLIPFNIFSLGIIFELMFFSLALSQRSIQIQLENQELQRKYTQELEQEIESRTQEISEKNKLLDEERFHKITSDFERKLAEVEMSALRSQMNPHFVFNCLNSIKLYSLENDSHTASEYLTKFSRLIRLVLENSRSEKVTLENELETLQLYLDMEAMRFKNKVNYQINVQPNIDISFIEIPPLLIQPYVENAIWHGLMHKTEGGKIVIDVLNPSPNQLKIEITDNGIGRKKAQEIKSKSASRNKSFGIRLTAERLELINQIYKTNASVEVIDLYNNSQEALGTKVIISISL